MDQGRLQSRKGESTRGEPSRQGEWNRGKGSPAGGVRAYPPLALMEGSTYPPLALFPQADV